MSDGLTEMAPAWGAPAWLAQALALYIADGGEIDLDLWRACVAASRAERTGWTDEARARSVEVRRDRQAEHDREAVAVIRTRRQAGLSWSAVAAELTAAALPPPRRPSRTGTGEWQADALRPWTKASAWRIGRRHGIE